MSMSPREPVPTPLPACISLARQQHGWTQQELADRLGTDATTISRWERGSQMPSPYYRPRLQALLGLSEAAFRPPPPPTPSDSPSSLPPALLRDPLMPPLPAAVVGRARDLAAVTQLLCAQEACSPQVLALTGLPGVGKTTLARQLAADAEIAERFPDGILWASLGPQPQPDAIVSRWASLLGLSPSETATLADRQALQQAVRQAIGGRRLLLILDDIWQVEHALAFQLGGPACACVVTTRFRDIAAYLSVQAPLELQELSTTDSVHLLGLLAPEVVKGARAQAVALALAVGGLPLALTLLGHTLRQQTYSGQPRRLQAALQRVSTVEQRLHVRVLDQRGEPLASQSAATPRSLESLLALSSDHLRPEVRQTFFALSVLPAKPHSFSEAAALQVSQGSGEHLDALVDAGLLEQEGDRYRLHQMIHEYATLHLTGATFLQAQERLLAFALTCIQQGQLDADREEQESPTLLLALESAAQMGRWEALVSLLLALLPVFLLRGSYALAEQYLRRAQQHSQPLSASQQLRLLHALGQTAHKQGRYEQAQQVLQQGLTLARHQGQQDLLLLLLADLGWVRWKRGAYAEAQAAVEEGLALARQREDQQGLSRLLQQLGVILARRGDYRGSEACLREGLALARQLGEPEGCCLLLLNLGITLLTRGACGPAERVLQEGLSLARQMRHREWVSLALLNLADLALLQRQEVQAQAYTQEGLALARQIEHPELMSGHLVNQGIIAYRQGEYQPAETALREGVSLAKRSGIPYLLGYAHYEVGNCALAQHQWEEAKLAFAAMEQVGRELEQELRALARYGQGRVAQALGQPEHAYELGQASLHLLEEIGQEEKAREVRHWLSAQVGPMDPLPHDPVEPEAPGT